MINGFFVSNNALNYGGQVNLRPEFLNNLANFFHDPQLADAWSYGDSFHCHVVKFAVPLSDYHPFSFQVNHFGAEHTDTWKKKWLIERALETIYDAVVRFSKTCEYNSFLQYHAAVHPSQILQIMTAEEYERDFT